VVILAGFRSSALIVRETSYAPWAEERVWLSVQKLNVIAQGSPNPRLPWELKNQYEPQHKATEADWAGTKDLWVRHLALNTNGDGHSDPEGKERPSLTSSSLKINITHVSLLFSSFPAGIVVRPLEGLAGIDYLSPGAVTSWFSFVFGPVIRVLRGCGYTDENMQASPYDWRIPPKFLEARDGYFTKLAVMIERVVTRTGKKVALLSHSMGYRVAHYFIKFVEVSPLPPPPLIS